MRGSLVLYVSLVTLTHVRADACGNQCDFFERCVGNVRQQCGGVDQCIGRRVWEEPCVAPNAACVETGQQAECGRSPVERCDGSFVHRCEGSLLLVCSTSSEGFVRALECQTGQACGLDGAGQAACVPAR